MPLRDHFSEDGTELFRWESFHAQWVGTIVRHLNRGLPRGSNGHAKVDVWPEALKVGAVLPTLPLWLRDDLAVPLELESTYEETCGDLRA